MSSSSARAGRIITQEASRAIAAGEEELLRTLDPGDRERFWTLLRAVADAASLCPREEEDVDRACREVHAEAGSGAAG